MRVAAELGDVPIAVVGDFNLEPRDSAIFCTAFSTGRWIDAHLAFSQSRGRLPTATCNAAADGSRIDAIICNSTLALSLFSVSVLQDTGLPTHRPVKAIFDMS
eukprot:12425300-Karenia_brevis.AAC.1